MPEETKQQPHLKIRSFDDIQLPEEDKNKPAEIDLNSPDGDEGTTGEVKEGAQKVETTKTGEQKPAEPAPEKPAEVKPEDKKPDEKLPPFHEHPDWKKMQEEKQQLEKEVAEMRGKIDVLTKTVTPAQQQQSLKTAEERLAEDIKNGWQPASQAEMLQRGMKYMREEMEQRQTLQKEKEQEQQDEQQKRQAETVKKMESTLAEVGVINPEEQKKVYDLVETWRKNGTSISFDTLKVAAENLKLKGEIGKAPAPTTTEPETDPAPTDGKPQKAEQTAEQKAAEEARIAANKHVNKPQGGSKPEGEETKMPAIKNGHKKDLDSIVLEIGKMLN